MRARRRPGVATVVAALGGVFGDLGTSPRYSARVARCLTAPPSPGTTAIVMMTMRGYARALAGAAIWAMTACGGGHHAASTPAPATSLEALTAIRDHACACTDAACGAAAEQDFEAWAQDHADAPGNRADSGQADRVAEEARACIATATATAGDHRIAPSDAASTGLPHCDEYVVAVRVYVECDKVPQPNRDGAQQGLDAMASGWADLTDVPADVLQQTDAACEQAVAALHQGLDALGCAY